MQFLAITENGNWIIAPLTRAYAVSTTSIVPASAKTDPKITMYIPSILMKAGTILS